MRQPERYEVINIGILFWGMDLLPRIPPVISCLSCFFEAGLRPVFCFNNTCAGVCVLVWGLDLLPHISLVVSCLPCLSCRDEATCTATPALSPHSTRREYKHVHNKCIKRKTKLLEPSALDLNCFCLSCG